jgi:pyruvate formate lyase activating enzyme
MHIGGFQKLSLIDYPGKLAAIVFTQGCNFRCVYCHNPELVEPRLYATPLSEENVLCYLSNRAGLMQGVVITGGEPSLQSDLPEFLNKVRILDYMVKLDTNGTNPEMLRRIIGDGLLDYIAMDVKAALGSYHKIVKSQVDTHRIEQCIRLIIDSGIPHEFRTTYLEPLLSLSEVCDIGTLVAGCDRYVIQSYMPIKSLESALHDQPTPSIEKMHEIKTRLTEIGLRCQIR